MSILNRFAKPDANALAVIRRELEQLPIHRSDYHVMDSELQFIGTITEALSRIEEELERDYDDTRLDSALDGYEFEYVLTRDGYMECEIAVMTRLFSSTKRKGSIIYEVSVIRRIGDDQYMVSTDEE